VIVCDVLGDTWWYFCKPQTPHEARCLWYRCMAAETKWRSDNLSLLIEFCELRSFEIWSLLCCYSNEIRRMEHCRV